MNVLNNKYLQLVVVILLCVIVEYMYFGPIFSNPNSLNFAFGGDALFLYFNTTYHACYGSGMMLESMNHPFGESIFMTDAQGSISVLLSTLRYWGIDTCKYGVGIVNGLMLYLLPVCASFIFLIFRRFQIIPVFAIVTSVAIALLSPQVYRIVSHYGLAYPFYIPMCIYWALRKFDLQRWEWTDVIFISISAFFYLNNPYIGFAGLLFIPIICLIAVIKRYKSKSFLLQYFTVTASIILGGYGLIKLSDPFINRIKEQSGFFLYNIDFRGLFNSKYGFTNQVLSTFTEIRGSGIESTINYGIIPLLACIILIVLYIKSKKNKTSLPQLLPNADYKYIFIGALLLALVACNGILPRFIQDFITKYFSQLLLFKATGRFIWLSYFAIGIWTVWYIQYLILKISNKNTRSLLFSLIAIIWIWEACFGLGVFNSKSRGSNLFKQTDNYRQELVDQGIEYNNYQAILALPLMQGWASKLQTPLHWRSQYESTIMSISTALPIVDGMLSRMSLDHAMNIVQLGSNPLIHRNLSDQITDKRPILLMDMSEKEALPTQQDYLLSRSTLIGKLKHCDLYRLEIDSLQSDPYIDRVKAAYAQKDSNLVSPIHYDSFSTSDSNIPNFYSAGSKTIEPGKFNLLYQTTVDKLQDSTMLELSFWTLFTPAHEQTPVFTIECKDANGNVIDQTKIKSYTSRDVQDNWVRIAASISSSSNIKEILVYSTSKKQEYIDDLMLRYWDSNCIVEEEGKDNFLFNNYKVKK